jgi:hypothetical protein
MFTDKAAVVEVAHTAVLAPGNKLRIIAGDYITDSNKLTTDLHTDTHSGPIDNLLAPNSSFTTCADTAPLGYARPHSATSDS